MKTKLKKILAAPFVLLAALVVLFEDWLWDDLLRLAAALGRLPVLRRLEAWIAKLPPYGALACFAAPSLLLIPVKLIALWCLAHGQAALGLATALAAKVIGTALVARIYALTETQLLQIHWFAALHAAFVRFKTRVYARLHQMPFYQFLHEQKLRWRAWLHTRGRSWLRARWEAALRFSKRGKPVAR